MDAAERARAREYLTAPTRSGGYRAGPPGALIRHPPRRAGRGAGSVRCAGRAREPPTAGVQPATTWTVRGCPHRCDVRPPGARSGRPGSARPSHRGGLRPRSRHPSHLPNPINGRGAGAGGSGRSAPRMAKRKAGQSLRTLRPSSPQAFVPKNNHLKCLQHTALRRPCQAPLSTGLSTKLSTLPVDSAGEGPPLPRAKRDPGVVNPQATSRRNRAARKRARPSMAHDPREAQSWRYCALADARSARHPLRSPFARRRRAQAALITEWAAPGGIRDVAVPPRVDGQITGQRAPHASGDPRTRSPARPGTPPRFAGPPRGRRPGSRPSGSRRRTGRGRGRASAAGACPAPAGTRGAVDHPGHPRPGQGGYKARRGSQRQLHEPGHDLSGSTDWKRKPAGTAITGRLPAAERSASPGHGTGWRAASTRTGRSSATTRSAARFDLE